MLTEASFDPHTVSPLLEALAASLKRPGGGPGSVERLEADLAEIVRVCRAWARQRSVSPACIPRPPEGELTNDRAAEFLTELADVLRYLAVQARPLHAMTDVIEFLRERREPALFELAELSFAVRELENCLRAVQGELGGELVEGTAEGEQDRAQCPGRGADRLTLIVSAFSELQKGVEAWRLAAGSGSETRVTGRA